MQLAVFAHHLYEAAAQTGRPIGDIMTEARALGITGVEYDMADLRDPAGELFRLQAAGLCVSSIYGFHDFGRNPDPARGLAQADLAVSMQAERIMIIPGFHETGADPAGNDADPAGTGADSAGNGADQTATAREADRMRMLEAVAAICAYAGTKGLTVTMEDFDDAASPIATSAGMLWFAERIPSLRITFDTGNFLYSGEAELEAFERLSGRIVHVHCKDRALDGSRGGEPKTAVTGLVMHPCPVGSGSIRMAAILEDLKGIGYTGFLTIEHFGAPDQLAFLRQSATWLKERIEA